MLCNSVWKQRETKRRTKEIMEFRGFFKCPHYEIFGKDKETVPRNRKIAQASLNIHLIVSGIKK